MSLMSLMSLSTGLLSSGLMAIMSRESGYV
jgi:hypothetical protein